jgi:hypothetical protein
MNKVFADHVTTTAFFLSVSKKQIRYLSVLFHSPWPAQGYYLRDFSCTRDDPDNWISSYRALTRKGLVISVTDDTERNTGHYELTQAGKLLCEMLVEAGLIEEREQKELAA